MAIPSFVLSFAGAQGAAPDSSLLNLDSPAAQLVIDPAGGAIIDFHLSGQDLNPLTWDSWNPANAKPGDKPSSLRTKGHFVCLDRWGPPNEADKALGIGPHGEAPRSQWTVDQPAQDAGDHVSAVMSVKMPLAGMTARREIKLLKSGAVFSVRETVINENTHGRIYNVVQHPSIGLPFLSTETLVDTNATRGVIHGRDLHDESTAIQWPSATDSKGAPVDLRHVDGLGDPVMSSFIIEDEYGWATAASPDKGLLIGYLWKKADYPWLNLWRRSVNGKVFSLGLEFGTTGLEEPFADLVKQGSLLGWPLFNYVDTKDSASLQYACFLMPIPADFTGVEKLTYDGKAIVVKPLAANQPDITIETGELFAAEDKKPDSRPQH